MLNRDEMMQAVGSTAYGSDGEKIGKVGQVYLDDQTDQPAWATVNTGFFGSSESFVPLANASLSGDRLEVAYAKDTVKDAPHIGDEDGHLTPEAERALYDYYGMGYASERQVSEQTMSAAATSPQPGSAEGADDAMTLSEERIEVTGTESRPVGRARLRKVVETEYVTQTVPVRRERIIVENVPAGEGGDIVDDDPGLGPEVVLHEERPVIEKVVEPVERVRLGTEQFTTEETVSETVRHEQIQVEGDATDPAEGTAGRHSAADPTNEG